MTRGRFRPHSALHRKAGSSPRWRPFLILSVSAFYALRSWWHSSADDWLLEEEFRRERAITRQGQRSIRAAVVHEAGVLPVQQIQPSDFEDEHQRRQERGDNFLFRIQAPEELWDDLPSWAKSYWEWHATMGANAKRVMIYHPPMNEDDGFRSLYDAVELAADTNRLFLVHWTCEQSLTPSLQLDWRVPERMRNQPLPAPIDQYRSDLLRDNPSDVIVVQSVVPEEKPGVRRQHQQRAYRALWKGLFRPTSVLQDQLLHLVQTALDNRPYAAVWMSSLPKPQDGETKKELALSTALQTVQCAHWLWEQAHHHFDGDPPMVYLVMDSGDTDLRHTTHHPTAMEQRLDRALSEIQPFVVIANAENFLSNIYLAAGADCLVYSGTSKPFVAALSESDCRLPFEDCPIKRLRDTEAS